MDVVIFFWKQKKKTPQGFGMSTFVPTTNSDDADDHDNQEASTMHEIE